ncbi:hypothetical protein YC2023_080976 [Brassica napus]
MFDICSQTTHRYAMALAMRMLYESYGVDEEKHSARHLDDTIPVEDAELQEETEKRGSKHGFCVSHTDKSFMCILRYTPFEHDVPQLHEEIQRRSSPHLLRLQPTNPSDR